MNRLVEEETESDRVQFLMALAHSGRGDAVQAKAGAARALELNPHNVQARILLADLHYRERDFAAAEKESLAALTLSPSSVKALLILGNSYLHRRDYEKSRQCFESIIRLSPDSPMGYIGMGQLSMVDKRQDDAVEYLQKALDRDPFQMEALSNLVLILLAPGKSRGCLQRLRQAA